MGAPAVFLRSSLLIRPRASQRSRILPSTENVTTCQGIILPLFCRAVTTARSSPPQQGTSIRRTVTLDIVLAQDLGQLFAVIHIVQLGAADQRHFAPHELLMDIGIGIRRAVCRHQKLGPCKVGGVHRHQLDLAGPLGQL